MPVNAVQLVLAVVGRLKQPRDIGMANRFAAVIGQQILLADIGDIAAIGIFREKMIEGLVSWRLQVLWNRFIPFLAIGEDRIDIIDHAAEIENPVADDIANGEARIKDVGRVGRQGIAGLEWIC